MNDSKRCPETIAGADGLGKAQRGRCRLPAGHDGAHQYLTSRDYRRLQELERRQTVTRGGLSDMQAARELGAFRAAVVGEPDVRSETEGERLMLAAISRARRTIVLEIDSLRADNESTRADALQDALNAVDHIFAMMALQGEGWR